MKLLLDTHVLLWWLQGSPRLSRRQDQALRQISPEQPVWVSDISLWEIATLVGLGRIELELPLQEWLERATAPPLVQLSPITPAIAAELAQLPESFHRDPADRILVASARVLGATLLTQDRRILDAGIVPTLS